MIVKLFISVGSTSQPLYLIN